MSAFPYFRWLTVRVATGRESCPDCGLSPASAFCQHDGTYALWCSNDHRWITTKPVQAKDKQARRKA